MTWGMVAGAAITVVGGIITSNKNKKGMDGATAAQMEAVASQERIAAQQLAQSDKQFDYMAKRQETVDKVSEEVTRRQLAMAEETQGQGRDLYNYQKDVFRPVEQSLVAQAMRESTPEHYEQYAQQAMATQANANANAQAQTERLMAGMGVNPNSGAFASAQRGIQLSNAAGMGALANESRDKAEALGWARKADVMGLGKGLVGAANASYGLAANANDSAANATNGANAQAIAGMGSATQWAGLANQSNATLMQGSNQLYQNQLNAYNSANQNAQAGFSALGGMAQQYFTNRAKSAPPRPGGG